MAGTSDAVAEDALYVLTAALLTPAQFPSVLGDDYPAACATLALEPYAEGYGLVLGQDSDGARWTVAVDDVSVVAAAIAAWDCGMEYDLSPDDRSMVCALPGWPLPVAVAAPDLPAPHNPPSGPGTGGTGPVLLAPPDTDAWGPAQRRMGADEIAHRWAAWREQLDEERARTSAGPADDAEAPDRGDTPRGAAGAFTGDTSPVSHAGLRRALAEAHSYLEAPPPPGRVRSSFAGGDARMLRADGPGWSLVARTDDVAFVLLDDEPGEVLPVGRGAALPGLLESLEAIAVRPA
ncbi:hypothetical protein [Streptomyces sp. NPDC056061]|uniref:hypothetical protein n=1 Tax=Streptomyces sp. NPDC056061 TaxID=3345700 RepID=UPI0035D54CCD